MLSVLVATDRHLAGRPLDEVVTAAVDGGASLIILREFDLPEPERVALAAQLSEVVAPIGGRLVLATPDGGLGAGRLCRTQEAMAAAAAEGAAFAALTPIFPTRSLRGYSMPLGLAALARLCAATAIPVYACGGVDSPRRARDCVNEGAAGVMVLGSVMRAADPRRFVKELVMA